MAENPSKLKTIAIDQETHELILHLSKANGKNNGQLVKAMAKYFSKYGIDPTIAPANLAKEIKNLDKRFISFIREQEERYHIPQGNQMELLKKEVQKIAQFLERNSKPQTDQEAKVEILKKALDYYKQIVHNVYQYGLKQNYTLKTEDVKLVDVLEISKKLLQQP